MNNRTKITAVLLMLTISLAWLDVAAAKGPRVKVEQAIPGEAEQGQQILAVKIKGSGFQAGDTVHFLVAGTKDEAQIDVSVAVYDPATGDLNTIINVSEKATISGYDIEIRRTSGRGGKGTDLFKVKGKGGGKPPPDPEPPVETSCYDYESAFPSFAYAVQTSGRKGNTGYDIFLSNADGDCSILIHTTGYKGNNFELAYSQSGNNGVITWKQSTNENAGRKDPSVNWDQIKVLRFTASNKEMTTSLPLALGAVANSGADGITYKAIDLSSDGNTIVVSYADASDNSVRLIDISNCSSNCSLGAPLYSHLRDFASSMRGLSFNAAANRIYFSSRYNSNNMNFVAFIEKSGTTWSLPRMVTTDTNGSYGANVAYFLELDVASFDFGYGLKDAVAVQVNKSQDAVVGPTFYTQLINVGSCSTVGSGDCVSSGDSVIVEDIALTADPSFDNKSSANSLLLSTAKTDNSDIVEYDIMSRSTTVRAFGWQAESGL